MIILTEEVNTISNIELLEKEYLSGLISLDILTKYYLNITEKEILKSMKRLKYTKPKFINELLNSKDWDKLAKKLCPYILQEGII